MRKLREYLSAIFFPERCPYCDNTVEVGKPACVKCMSMFPETCSESYAKGGYSCVSPFLYTGIFAESVKRFKFNNRPYYAEKLAEQIANCVSKQYGGEKFDYITCVPMHSVQLKKRGYNQSRLLAENIAKKLGIPYADLLEKYRKNEPQHSLSLIARKNNVKGVYRAINTDKIIGNNILITDDILTSGYTLGECCRILDKAGAKSVKCAVLCIKILQ